MSLKYFLLAIVVALSMCHHFDQKCPANTSDCMTANGVVGCCRFKKAVCCPAVNGCCPKGFTCTANGCEKPNSNEIVEMEELNGWTLASLKKINWNAVLGCLSDAATVGPDVLKLIKAIKAKDWIECAKVAFDLLGKGSKVVTKCINRFKNEENGLKEVFNFDWEGLIQCILSTAPLVDDIFELVKAIKAKDYQKAITLIYSLIQKGSVIVKECMRVIILHHNSFKFNWEAFIKCIQKVAPLVPEIIELIEVIKQGDYAKAIQMIYKLIESGSEAVKECMKVVIINKIRRHRKFKFDWEAFLKCLQAAAPLAQEILELIEAIKAKDFVKAIELARKLIEDGSAVVKECMKVVLKNRRYIRKHHLQRIFLKFDWEAFLKCIQATAPVAEEIIELIDAINKGDYVKAIQLIYKLIADGSEAVKECMKVVLQKRNDTEELFEMAFINGIDWKAILQCIESAGPLVKDVIELIKLIKTHDYVKAIKLAIELAAKGSKVIKKCLEPFLRNNGIEPNKWFHQVKKFVDKAVKTVKKVTDVAEKAKDIVQRGQDLFKKNELAEIPVSNGFFKKLGKFFKKVGQGIGKALDWAGKALSLIQKGKEVYQQGKDIFKKKNEFENEENGFWDKLTDAIDKVGKTVDKVTTVVDKTTDIIKKGEDLIQKGKDLFVRNDEAEMNGWLDKVSDFLGKVDSTLGKIQGTIDKATGIIEKGKDLFQRGKDLFVRNDEIAEVQSNGFFKKLGKFFKKVGQGIGKALDWAGKALSLIQKGKEVYQQGKDVFGKKKNEFVNEDNGFWDKLTKTLDTVKKTVDQVTTVVDTTTDIIKKGEDLIQKGKDLFVRNDEAELNGWFSKVTDFLDKVDSTLGKVQGTIDKATGIFQKGKDLFQRGKDLFVRNELEVSDNRMKVKFNVDWKKILECLVAAKPVAEKVIKLIKLIQEHKYAEAFALGQIIIKEGGALVKKCFNKSTINDIAVNIDWKALARCLVEHLPEIKKEIDVVKQLIKAIKNKDWLTALKLLYQLYDEGKEIIAICLKPTKNKIHLPKIKVNWDLLLECIEKAGPIAKDVVDLVMAIKAKDYAKAVILIKEIIANGNQLIKKCFKKTRMN